MSTAQIVALVAVVAVIGGAFYMLSQQASPNQAYLNAPGQAGPTDQIAQYITAGAGVLGSVASIIAAAEGGGGGGQHGSTGGQSPSTKV